MIFRFCVGVWMATLSLGICGNAEEQTAANRGSGSMAHRPADPTVGSTDSVLAGADVLSLDLTVPLVGCIRGVFLSD